MSAPEESGESFRDRLATIDKRGRRLWVYPAQPKGRFYTARTVVSILLLAFLFGAPFVRLGGNPLVQFDIINRKFFIFGMIFWPQDIYIFPVGLITFVVFVILFTVAFGRLFCGWVCPQTVFMEMVFRRVEYFIEGNRHEQRALTHSPWTIAKLFKRVLKHSVFFGLSFLVGNILLAFIIGTDALWRIVTDPPSEHLTGLGFMMLFSLIFYFIFARFREQACTLVCPYGRLQSVLLDSHSTVIAYDFKRGEPRGTVKRGEDMTNRGHCIDCNACVIVCPTGIDIRNGTQLECVNCAACIDACDGIMERMHLPRGLVRYASMQGIADKTGFRMTARIVTYLIAFLVLLTVFVTLLIARDTVETTILRAPGSLYEELTDGTIRNLYTVRIVNESAEEVTVSLKLMESFGSLDMVGGALTIAANSSAQTAFVVAIPRERLYTPSTSVRIGVFSGEEKIDELRTNFSSPGRKGNK